MSGWSRADIPAQDGRRVIVTGANSGIGAETAIALAAAGARVTLACRTIDKARVVADRIGPSAVVAHLDLSDLASVRAFADTVDETDVLVNNAGVMAVPYALTADGFEMQMGTNHLGHFALTALLLPRVTERVVVLTSHGHRFSRLNVDDLNWERRRYRRQIAYGDSKFANMLFGLELAQRFERSGSTKLAVLAHPGYAQTGLMGKSETAFDRLTKAGEVLRVGQSAARGALPTLFAATSPDAVNGGYYGPDGIGGLRGSPTVASRRRRSDDQDLRDRLWAESERLVGIEFPPVT
ncbi:short-chain dehydrogenase [Gordonia spumicola]|uniref:Short-chain dehydrogenase n=1 Tax=Gordonia spumicola TaxID=589161 RepID=A0A7I9V7P3_9ACTN|nr:oxidoreductase [Gordonia spumicola]GEE01111.1 short-chain dehydrogenase [Gordonia spumicola]